MSIIMALGERVKIRRTEIGMSQEELSKIVGVGISTINKMELRDNDSSRKANELADALGVNVKWLLKGIEPMICAQDAYTVDLATLGNRIKQRREEIGLSQADISRYLGLKNNSTINTIEKGSAKNSKHVEKIAECLGVNYVWLLTGEDSTQKMAIPTQQTIAVDLGGDKSKTHEKILRYDVILSAGNGTASWVVRENDDDPLFFRKGWFKAKRLNSENLRALTVRGNSMEPYLFNHDTVIIDVSDIELVDGDTYALVYKNHFYVKELQNIDGEVRIISKNEEKYKAMQTDKSEADKHGNYFQILGRVVWRGG